MSAPVPPLTRYAQLRGDGDWPDATLEHLEVNADGGLELRRVPLVSPPSISAPGPTAPSGIALDHDCGLYLLDGDDRRLVRVGLGCGAIAQLRDISGQGACVGPLGWLFVADPAGAIRVFATPQLTLRDAWMAGLAHPFAVAPAGACGLYVIDDVGGPAVVLRFDLDGESDQAWNARMAPPAGPAAAAIAAAPDGTLFVATGGNGVHRFTADGHQITPALLPGSSIAAVAYAAGIVYAADTATGEILLVDAQTTEVLGSVAGFAGPVAGLSVSCRGDLYIKPDSGDRYLVARAEAGRAAGGTATSGPLDAGETQVWARVAAASTTPAGSNVTLETCTADSDTGPPSWTTAPATDSLVPSGRYLWVRVTLNRGAAADVTPTVADVACETLAESYLQYLPAVYTREASTLLVDLLALAKAEFGDLEARIAGLHTLYDPPVTPVEVLAWLAAWQALPLPPGAPATVQRALIEGLPAYYPRRGTLAGVRRAIEVYAGVNATIFEDFRSRGIWSLGTTSALGFDTQLCASAVDGQIVGEIVVGESGPEDGTEWGSALFSRTAHQATVVVAVGSAPAPTIRPAIERVLAAEAPAHCEYHVCVATPRLRVGVQATVGVDAIVGRTEPMALGERSTLNLTTRLAGSPAGAIGRRARLGEQTVIG